MNKDIEFGLTVKELIDLLEGIPGNWYTNISPKNNTILTVHEYSKDNKEEYEYVLLGLEARNFRNETAEK